MIRLPNEKLLQTAGELRTPRRVGKNDGFISWEGSTDEQRRTAAFNCCIYQNDMLNLGNMALTCKRLTPIAQNILYCDVALLSPRLENGTHITPKVSFLHTLIKRPDLACLVEHLAVWMWKNLPIDKSKQGTCSSAALIDIVERIYPTSSSAWTQWMRDLQYPNEGSLCALVLASLPKLMTLELYSRSFSSRRPGSRGAVVQDLDAPSQSTGSYAWDNNRLGRALALTHIQELTLSSGLNGLHVAKLPSLKTLTVDYSQANPFVYVPKGFFPNVKTLIIQRLATDSNNNREDPFLMIFADKVNTLIRSLPNVHTMELTSIEGAELCHIPTYVEGIIIRSELATMGEPLSMKDSTLLAQINAIAWGC
jgi:hypothetical protein